jgi:hypothetical protein
MSRTAALKARDEMISLVIRAAGQPLAERDLKAYARRHDVPYRLVRELVDRMERGDA